MSSTPIRPSALSGILAGGRILKGFPGLDSLVPSVPSTKTAYASRVQHKAVFQPK